MKIAMFLLVAITQTGEPDTLRLSLTEAVDRALEANPTLKAQEAKAEARAQLPLQASLTISKCLKLWKYILQGN